LLLCDGSSTETKMSRFHPKFPWFPRSLDLRIPVSEW
jgi:hypothetical protein